MTILEQLTQRIRDARRGGSGLTRAECEELRQLAIAFLAQELPTTTEDVPAVFAEALNQQPPDVRSLRTDGGFLPSRRP